MVNLGQLVHRSKNKKYRNLDIGEVVLIECDNLKRLDWPLALVIEVLPDKDGTVRLAKVKTQNRILLRPVQRLYPLELTSKEDPIRKSYTKTIDRHLIEKEVSKKPEAVLSKPEEKSRCGRTIKMPLKYKTFFAL